MNYSELVEIVAAGHGLTKVDARGTVETVLKAIAAAAARGEEVTLPGFGRFKVSERPERSGRNPATGGVITIPAARRVGFTAAKALKDAVNGQPGAAAAAE